MYNHHLITFLQVADSGSFLQAGEKMFISATAVTKQINLLEQHLNVKLFERSTQGLKLTAAGKLIYKESKQLIRHSDTILQKARELENRQEYVIRVGVSLMNSSKILLEEWGKASKRYPNIKLQIVPFEDDAAVFFDIIENFGKKIDVIPCCYMWDIRCNTFHLRDLPFYIAFAKNHRLANHTEISITDLYKEQLIMLQRGVSDSMDCVRDDLENNHPQIAIHDVEVYGYHLFNEIAANDQVLLSTECWADVHPLIASVPVKWNHTIPYGLVYAKEPAKEVLQFIMAIGNVNPVFDTIMIAPFRS